MEIILFFGFLIIWLSHFVVFNIMVQCKGVVNALVLNIILCITGWLV